MSFGIYLDTSQPRLGQDYIGVLSSGGFEAELQSNKSQPGWSDYWTSEDANGEESTFVDPVTKTLMLKPLQMTELFKTTATGLYARLAKTDFTLTSAEWWEEQKFGAASKFLSTKNSTFNEAVITSATLARNRGVALTWFVSSSGEDSTVLRGGWNSSATLAGGVGFVLKANGECEIYKNGFRVGKYSLSDKVRRDRQFVSLYLIPCRRRDLLVLTTDGIGFAHTFDDIDELDDDPTITEATNFWWEVPEGQAAVQTSLITYPTSGWRASRTHYTPSPPPAGESPSYLIFSSGEGTVSASARTSGDATVAFTADGTTAKLRNRIDMTSGSSNTQTPFVYGVLAEWPTRVDYTPDDPTDLSSYTLAATIDVPEDPAGIRVTATLKDPESIDPGDARRLLTSSNRAVQVRIGDLVIVDGRTEPVPYEESTTEETDRIQLEARSLWKGLENYIFSDPLPLDGLTLREAFLAVCTIAGLPEDYTDIEDAPVTLPQLAGSRGDWAFLVRRGDNAADVLVRLKESFAGTWFLGEVPQGDQVRLVFKSPEVLGQTSLATVYKSAADVQEELESYAYVARTFKSSSLEPEANEIWVVGLDPRTFLPIIAHLVDYDSIDPTIDVGTRPDNWMGERKKYTFGQKILTTQASVDAAAELLARRLNCRRYLVEFESELLIDQATLLPVWRGQCITIDGEIYRIVTMSISVVQEADSEADVLCWRPTRYVAEKVVSGTSEGCGYSSRGTSIYSIRAFGLLGGFGAVKMQLSADQFNRPAVSSTTG